MSETIPEPDSAEAVAAAWMKSIADFWGGITGIWTQPGNDPSADTSRMSGTQSVMASMDAAAKNWQAAASTVASSPEVLMSLVKGTGAIPEILLQLSQNTFNGFVQLQAKWSERMSRLGENAEAYSFENLDENIFRSWSDMYESEFRQFFRIPQLGLTRTYQEKINRALDQYNIFQSTMAEFTRLIALPIARSFVVMQETLGDMAEKGTIPDDSQKYYQLWIRILEGHYMTLFQSPEYIQTLAQTLKTLSDFSAARDAVLEDMLSSLPIPRRKEIDELERDVYELKKRVRMLEKQK